MTKQQHLFNKLPPKFNPLTDGIPVYMMCECGAKWYSDKPTMPKSACTRKTEKSSI